MKSLTETQLKDALERAYKMGWKDRNSYHEKGSQYWGNVTRADHDKILRKNRDDRFKEIIGNF